MKSMLLYVAIPTGSYFESINNLFPLLTTLWVLPTVIALSAAIAMAFLFITPTIAVIVFLIKTANIVIIIEIATKSTGIQTGRGLTAPSRKTVE